MGEPMLFTPTRADLFIGVIGALFFIVYFRKYRSIERLLDNVPQVSTVAVLGVVVVFCMLQFTHMQNSILSAVENLSYRGLWEGGVIVFAIAVAASLNYHKDKSQGLFYILVFSMIFFLALTYFRAPLRLGWADSGNRNLLHFFPSIILLAYLYLIHLAEALPTRDKTRIT